MYGLCAQIVAVFGWKKEEAAGGPRFYERSPKGSIPDVVYMRIAHRGETLPRINSGFARARNLC